MLKVNLGSGTHKLDGWLNVDIAAADNPDLVADLTQPLVRCRICRLHPHRRFRRRADSGSDARFSA